MSLMATIECALVGACVEHHISAWSLHSVVRLMASIYAASFSNFILTYISEILIQAIIDYEHHWWVIFLQGVVCSALAFCIMSWCIERKGPLYVSVFTPLLLVITAVLSWALLREKIDLGMYARFYLIIQSFSAPLTT